MAIAPHPLLQLDVVALPQDGEAAVGQRRVGPAAGLGDVHRPVAERAEVALLHDAHELVAPEGGAVLPLGQRARPARSSCRGRP